MVDMAPTALQAENIAKEQKFLEDFYAVMEVGKEQEMSRRLIQEITRVDPGRMHFVLIALQRANAYTMRFEWHDPNKPGGGKHAYWTVHMPYEQAKEVLDKAQQEHLFMQKTRYSETRKKVIATKAAKRSANGITYSTGPDMPKGIGIKTFSPAAKQPKALVEAARQYGPKLSAAKQAFETLKSAGFEVDESTFFQSMNVPQDERLEVVSLILPYIESLEQQVKALKEERRLAARATATVGQ